MASMSRDLVRHVPSQPSERTFSRLTKAYTGTVLSLPSLALMKHGSWRREGLAPLCLIDSVPGVPSLTIPRED